MISHEALEHVIGVFERYGKRSSSKDIQDSMIFVVGVLHSLNNGLTHDPAERTPDWLSKASNDYKPVEEAENLYLVVFPGNNKP